MSAEQTMSAVLWPRTDGTHQSERCIPPRVLREKAGGRRPHADKGGVNEISPDSGCCIVVTGHGLS
jgi:hypothetical protein